MAAGKYRTIVADPPWEYPEGFATSGHAPHKQDRDKGAKPSGRRVVHHPYSFMTVEAISELPVPELALPDCRLFLWTTNKYLPAAFSVLRAWGFTFRQLLVWDKTPNFSPFPTSVAPNAAEFLLVALTGKPPRTGAWHTSIIPASKGRNVHSQKPDLFADIIELVSPGPYLELFARRQRLGWDTWGNEALEHVELA